MITPSLSCQGFYIMLYLHVYDIFITLSFFLSQNGLTPMHLCAQEDHVNVAEILCKYDAAIDPTTKAGYTPLHTASHFGQINMVKFLLARQADVDAKTRVREIEIYPH